MLNIQKQFISYNRSVRTQSIKYIVIHSTGNVGDTAQNNHDYFASGNRGASADFFVDDNNIIQIIDSDNYYSWHCGDGHGAYGISNGNSIGIEMCGTDGGNISEKTINNTVELVRYLMDKYSIDIDHTKMHYDASKKHCPYQFMSNNFARWYDFKERVQNGIKKGEWKLSNNKWWFEYPDKSYPKDCWAKLPKGNNDSTLAWFLFDTEGYMLTMWQSDEGKWYQLGEDGVMKSNTWYYDKKLCKWYWLKEDGSMAKDEWIKDNDEWHYLNTDGSMHTGWLNKDGFTYLLYSNGSMAHDTEIYGYSIDSNGHAIKIN